MLSIAASFDCQWHLAVIEVWPGKETSQPAIIAQKNKTNTIKTHLIKVGQTVRILAKTLILSSESISGCYLSELLQIHNVQSTTWR